MAGSRDSPGTVTVTLGYSATGGGGGGGGGWGLVDGTCSPGIVLGLSQLFWRTATGGGKVDGCPGIVLGLPQLLWCIRILCHRGWPGGWLSRSPGIVPGLP